MIDTLAVANGMSTGQYEKLSGQIDTIIYENSPFIIAKLKNGTIIKGSLSSPQRGCVYTFDGRWENHPQHGLQFAFVDYELDLPQDEEAIRDYLRENAPQIGPQRSREIVKRFGVDSLTVCRDEPERLTEIPGITMEAARGISESLRQIADSAALDISLRQIFAGARVTRRTIEAVKELWGSDAPARIRSNPFALIEEEDVPGVGFVIADQIARNCGYTPEGTPRIRAGVTYALNEAAQSAGHVCLPRPVLVRSAADLLGLSDAHVESVLPDMEQRENEIVIVNVDGIDYVYSARLYKDEQTIARRLVRLLQQEVETVKPDLTGLHEDQQAALRNALQYPVSVITGAPGTGKTHTIRKIVESLRGRHVALAAPTGKAAKRISELVGRPAQTIHRLLEPQVDGASWSFDRGFDKPIEADTIVLDEVSMVDTRLMAQFVEAVGLGTRLILVGDIHQLPSVGPGNVLGELIESGVIPCAELTKIKRQDPGLIVTNCHRIKDGLEPELPDHADGDLVFIERSTPDSIREAIAELLCNRIPAKFGFDPFKEIQVLSPVKTSTDLSCTALNELLRDRLNPGANQGRFRVGDKVIQTKNDYDNGIVNGDIGYVNEIDRNFIHVTFENPDRRVQLSVKSNDLQLAYALTVHKYQGSECPAVIIPVHPSLSPLVCQRTWLYTAISRAQKLCILVGQREEVYKIVRRNIQERRLTNLRTMLREASSGKPREELNP